MPFLSQGKTNWIFLLIVVVLAAIVGGGILCLQKNMLQPGTITLSPQDETTNWKTYRDDDFGFEIKYPPNWEFGREIHSYFTPPNLGATIKFKPINKSYNTPHGEISYVPIDIVAYNFSFPDPEILNSLKNESEKILINNIEFIKLKTTPGKPAQEFFVENPKNSYAFITNYVPVIIEVKAGITLGEKSGYQTIFSHMLSTFRFIDIISVWPEVESFDLINKTFEGKIWAKEQKVKILTTDSTKFYRTSGPNWEKEYWAFPEFYSLLENWEGPGWPFTVVGVFKEEGTIIADEVYLVAQ